MFAAYTCQVLALASLDEGCPTLYSENFDMNYNLRCILRDDAPGARVTVIGYPYFRICVLHLMDDPALNSSPSVFHSAFTWIAQLRELGESNTMTLEDLWRTNAELASGFRLVAQAQVHEELGLPPPPPPPTVAVAQPPAVQHPLPQPPPPLPPPAQQQHAPPQQQPQPLAVQLPLRAPAPAPGTAPAPAPVLGTSRSPPPWAGQAPPPQDFNRAVQLASEVTEGARAALDASVRGDAAGAQVKGADAAGKAALLACLLGGEAAASGEAGVHLADLDPLDVRALARSNPAAVRRLYGEGFPFWCKQDGTRFSTQVQLDAHMDLLFRRKRARREQKGEASREWYCTGEQWMTDFGRLGPPASGAGNMDGVGGEGTGGAGVGGNGPDDGEELDPDGANSCVPADERFTKCRICGERFQMFFDNDEEEWMYRNTCYIRVYGDGAGDEAEDEIEDDDGDMGGVTGDDYAGEDGGDGDGGGRSRQIIVHKLCLDLSGLKDRERITWRDLMPGTPRQRKRPASEAVLDTGGAEEAAEGNEEDGGWVDSSSAAANGGSSGNGSSHEWDLTVSNGFAGDRMGVPSGDDAIDTGPSLKRSKVEPMDIGAQSGREDDVVREGALRGPTVQIP